MSKRLWLAALLAAACSNRPKEGGLVADVAIDGSALVRCVELSVSGTDGKRLVSKRFNRGSRNNLSIGIARSGDVALPDEIDVEVVGLWSSDGCTEPVQRNTAALKERRRFEQNKIDTVSFTLRAPSPSEDADGDGFVTAQAGGPDCDDAQRGVHPNALESCELPVDLNCNGKVGCDDATCSGVPCLRPAASLAFANPPLSVAANECSPAFIVEARDSTGQPTAVSQATTVTLREQGGLGVMFFSDSGCTLAASTLTLPAMQRRTQFFARTQAAGQTRVEASAPGLNTATQDFTVVGGRAANLALRPTGLSVKADACSPALTLQAVDMWGNDATLAAETAVMLTITPPAGVTLHADASCSTALANATLASNTGSLTFHFRATRGPGALEFEGRHTTLGMARVTVTITPGDPAAVVFATPTQTVVAGTCSSAVTLQLRDRQQTNTTTPSQIGLALSGQSMTFFSTPTCAAGSSVTEATVLAGAGTATVYFRATGAGTPSITVTGPGLPPASQTQTVTPGPAAKLGFTSAQQGVQATLCSGPVRLSTLDAFDNPTVVSSALPIALSANPGTGFSFYSSVGCASAAVTSITIAPGASSTEFSFRGTNMGPVVMTADSTLNPDPTQTATIVGGPPTTLVYVTPSHTQTANLCSSEVILESQDNGGNPSNVTAPVTINLTASPAMGFRFFQDSQCTLPITSLVLMANSSRASFYWSGTTAGTVAMNPMTGSLSGPGTQNAVVTPAVASALAFASPARTATAGVCSGALTLESRDAFGNRSAVSTDQLLTLSGTPSTGLTFHSDAACASAAQTTATLMTGQSQVTLYARGTKTPAYSLTAQNGVLGQASQPFTIVPAAADKLVVVSAAQTVPTGQCSNALVFERRDVFDNPVAVNTALTVNLTGTSGISFYGSASCAGAPITSAQIGASASTMTVYFRGTVAGVATVTGAAAGVPTPGTQNESITVSPPTVLAFLSPAQTAVAAGQVSAAVVLESRDGSGNPSMVSSNTPVSITGLPTGYVLCGDAACAQLNPTVQINANATTATFYFRGNVAQTFTLTATASIGMATQMETVVPGTVSQLVITSSAQSRSVGSCSLPVTVQRQDAFNNPVTTGGALSVMLSASPATGFGFYSQAGCAVGNAITGLNIGASASTATFYFNGTVPLTIGVTASASGLTAGTQNETITAVPPNHLAFLSAPMTLQAGACSPQVRLQAQDLFNNPAPVGSDTTVGLSATPAANAQFYLDAACATGAVTSVTISSGTTGANFYLRATGAGSHTLTAQNVGLGPVGQPLGINAGPPNGLVFLTSAQTVNTLQCSGIATVRMVDAHLNPSPVSVLTALAASEAPVGGVTFFSDPTCTTPYNLALNPGEHTGSFYFRGGATPQSVVIIINPGTTLNTAMQTETVVAGSATKLAFTSAAKNLMAGECSGAMTVQSQDSANNPSPVSSNTTVTLSAAPSTGLTFFTDVNCTTPGTSVSIPASGNSVSFSLRSITGGAPLVTATGAGLPTPATQTVNVAPAVRTGSCTLANATTSISCAISPALNADLTKTFFVFQATSLVAGLDSVAVRCTLLSASTLSCTRGGSQGDVSIRWYTVSRPTGLNVQHLPLAVPNGSNATSTVGISAVNTGSAFVLMSMSGPSGSTTISQRRLSSVRLASSTSVEIRRLTNTDVDLNYQLQVVEWTGAAVDRPTNSVNMANGVTSLPVSISSSAEPALLFHSWRYGNNSTQENCRLAVRGTLTDAATLTFTRALGASGNCNNDSLDIDWERVRFPGHRVEQQLVSMGAGATDATPVTVGAVDLTRAVPFIGSGALGGQSMGETSDVTVDRLRDSQARASFSNATTVQVSRAAVGAANLQPGSWTLLVWELVP